MRILLLAAAIVSAMPAAAQGRGPTGPTATAVKNAMDNAPPGVGSNGGTVGTDLQKAQEFMNNASAFCQFVEKDGKLVAACDNSDPAARIRASSAYVPQTATEWERFTSKLFDADRALHGRARAIVVLNGAAVVAEASSGGRVLLKGGER